MVSIQSTAEHRLQGIAAEAADIMHQQKQAFQSQLAQQAATYCCVQSEKSSCLQSQIAQASSSQATFQLHLNAATQTQSELATQLQAATTANATLEDMIAKHPT